MTTQNSSYGKDGPYTQCLNIKSRVTINGSLAFLLEKGGDENRRILYA